MTKENLSEAVLAEFPQYVHNVGFYQFTPYHVLVDLMLAESIDQNSIVMDAGCGSKSVIPENSLGVAVDIVHESVETLKQRRRNLDCVCASLEALPFKQACIDIVVSRDVLQHCNSALAIKEMGRVLKHGGKFIASTSNRFNPVILLGKLLGTFADSVVAQVGVKYFRRTRRLNPYSLKTELARAGLATKNLLMAITHPFLTAQTWRRFVKHIPWKLFPWLFVSIALRRARILRETLVVKAKKCVLIEKCNLSSTNDLRVKSMRLAGKLNVACFCGSFAHGSGHDVDFARYR